MINEDARRAVAAATWTGPFIRPLYDSYCFSQIPALIPALLGGPPADGLAGRLLGALAGTYDKVILFFVDAFGWRFFERYATQYAFLSRILEQGMVTQITAQFPSTTAAHVTAIHTGLPVGESGVYEWYYYEPLVDAMIAPLLFSFAGDRERDTLKRTGLDPAAFFPHRTLYQALAEQGISSFVFQQTAYTPSPYSDVVFAGAEVRPYRSLDDALPALAGAVLTGPPRSYYFFYFADIDSAGHRFGPASPEFEAAVQHFLTAAEADFHAPLEGRLHSTLFLMTADHGQVETDPATTIYLDETLPDLAPLIRTNAIGVPLVPAGSCRDLFLHIAEGALAPAQAMVQAHLAGRAEVHRVSDLVAQGFFGPARPAQVFLQRVGDLVVLPYAGESVWWRDGGRFPQDFYGHHGGLTRAEMETILLARAYQ